ncbi:MAG: hypothetical protein P0116_02310 [Candidatus Nitrosocosmicus sp.]|nr:hypothetical protein [Candidatus Nitrosocosmicus sp.]
MNSGKLYVVGVRPGHHDHMTFRAKQVIEKAIIVEFMKPMYRW